MDTVKICRTCLALSGPFLSIFDDTTGNSTGSIADMLRNFTNTKPKPADNMPEKVCLTCISEINRCYSFKMKCEQSNRTLRQLLPHALPEEPDVINNQAVESKPPVSTADKFAQTIPISVKKKETVSREVQTIEEDQEKNIVVVERINISNKGGKAPRRGGRKAKSVKDVKVVAHDVDDDGGVVDEGSEFYEITRDFDNVASTTIDKTKNNSIIMQFPKGEGEYTELIFNESTGVWCTRDDIIEEQCNAEEPVKQAEGTNNTEEYKFTIYNNENGEEEFAPSTTVTTRNSRARKRAANQNKKASPTSTSKNTRAKRSGVEKAKEIVVEMESQNKKRRRLLNSNADDDEDPLKLKHFCERCNAGFAIHKSLLIHQRHNNCTRQSFKCDECERVFISEDHLEEHRTSHNSKNLPCAECSEKFATKEELSKHMIKNHKRSSRNQCNVCQKVFTMFSALRDHMRIHTGEKPFVCQICNKGFTQNANMRQHMYRHSNTKRFQCDYCDSSFVTKGELIAHSRSHTGDKPFECDDCGAKFTTSSSLVKHKRRHTGEIPYACEMCPMRFTALNVLKNHRRTHTGERPYACPYCPRRFAQTGDCLMHQRNHHNMKRQPKGHTNNEQFLHITLDLDKKDSNDNDDAVSEKAMNNDEIQEFLQMPMEEIC